MAVKYRVGAVREQAGQYSVSVPALRGCHTWGHALAEAARMGEDAIGLYLEWLREDGEAPPLPAYSAPPSPARGGDRG